MSLSCGPKQEVIVVTDSADPNRPPRPEAGQGRLTDSSGAAVVTPRAYGILVVDDEACVRGVLDLGLRHHGFAVWLAADGREALDLYRRHRAAIDVVLLDVRLPGPDGPQTLAALRELDPRVRCCFMSGDLGSYTEEDLRERGAAGVLPKPFRLDGVARVLRELATAGDAGPAGRGKEDRSWQSRWDEAGGARHGHHL
jgi:CheY-like chemotaxis protein